MTMTSPEATAEKAARSILRNLGLPVQAVSFIHRYGAEFAAIVVGHEQPERLDEVRAMFGTPATVVAGEQPWSRMVIVREHAGRYDTRVYVAFSDGGRRGDV